MTTTMRSQIIDDLLRFLCKAHNAGTMYFDITKELNAYLGQNEYHVTKPEWYDLHATTIKRLTAAIKDDLAFDVTIAPGSLSMHNVVPADFHALPYYENKESNFDIIEWRAQTGSQSECSGWYFINSIYSIG